MENTLIFSLLSLSLALSVGVNYGFDRIYQRSLINNFKKYKKEIELSLIFSLRKLGLTSFKTLDLNNKVKEFIKQWQNYEDIKEGYNDLLNYRKNILFIFLATSFLYFISLVAPEITSWGKPTYFYSNLLFGIGIFIFSSFMLKLHSLNKNMTNYELNKPTFEESKQWIKNKVKKK